jgi:hypothetical protein
MWKEMIVAQFDAVSRNLCGGTEENYKTSSRIVGVRTEILNRHVRDVL